MRILDRLNSIRWLTVIGLALICATLHTQAGDLPAVSDGQHLWLIEQTPKPADDEDGQPKLTVYHLPTDTDTYLATKLDPITGQFMPRGVAAGDGRLLLVNNDRQVMTVRPVWSDLLRNWEYQRRSLTELPEGCTLVSLAMGDHGPWALVQVQSRELLEQLDQVQVKTQPRDIDQRMLNQALGLPEDLQWGDLDERVEDDETPAPDQTPEDATELDEQSDAPDATDVPDVTEQDAQPTLPAYRLIHLRNNKWTRSPLPEYFDVPREAKLLIRPGDDRPTLLVDSGNDFRRAPRLVRYNPIAPVKPKSQPPANDEAETNDADEVSTIESPTWVRLITGMQLRPGRQWSADLINGQIVVALERFRPQEVVTIDTFLLRGNSAYEIGYAHVNTGDNARWALFPMQNDIGLIASPAPAPDPSVDQANRLPTLAFLAGLSMDGQPMFQNDQGQAMLMPISEKKPTAFQGNADLIIQILAFIAAIFMMVMFYRRAPQQDQLDLPEHLVLASFSRRALGGVIDLAPGFILAGLIYDVTVGEVIFESWPGNGIVKAFAAMRPGFVVIGVTLLHTTICEFILARSLGKIMMGMYVADLNGKPAPPLPCLGRALSRAFELFAPLMILVAIISPARQRLGDILAKTIVVMRKPEPFEEEDNDQ